MLYHTSPNEIKAIHKNGLFNDCLFFSAADWMLQAKRGECALKMGFDGCQDRDEQGTVYIIPMFEKEHILSLCKDYE